MGELKVDIYHINCVQTNLYLVGQPPWNVTSLGLGHLRDHFHHDRMRLAVDGSHSPGVSPENEIRLCKWISGEGDRILWIHAPKSDLKEPEPALNQPK